MDTGAVASPSFSRPSGRYVTGRPVTISCSTPGAEIRYTTDGSEPTETSALYSSPIPVAASETIRARGYKAGMDPSAERRADYWLTGALAAGWEFSVALRTDGTVWAWGRNNYGQLGDGTTTNQLVPQQVPGLADIVGIAAGTDFVLALKADGTVWTWGRYLQTVPTQVAGLSDIVQVSTSVAYRTALRRDGTVWTWNTATAVPAQMAGLAGIAETATGTEHRLALRTDGAISGVVWGWGGNDNGELGDGTTTARTTPVTGISGAVALSVSGRLSLALLADGSALGWGRNEYGALGYGDWVGSHPLPVEPAIQESLSGVIAGYEHSLFVTRTGWLWAVGRNSHGQLGRGNTTTWEGWPASVFALSQVTVAAAHQYHSLAAIDDLSVWAWGWGQYGRIGDGATTTRSAPVSASGFTLGDNAWLIADSDDDGLSNVRESRLGTDHLDADTNDDGIPDGIQVASGQDPLDLDVDDDGVLNGVERQNGTDPFRADSDEDGVSDLTDCFPLDPTRTTCPPPVPGDTTPPTITLEEPTNAVLISTIP
ncbi:MAG: hypothetical protein AMXMBFR36_16340 [Acidobacteriota bacterium]